MRRRLANLVARGLVERKGSIYSVTPDGLLYLQETEDEDAAASDDQNQIWALVRQHANTVRDRLHRRLHDMDPFAFEHLIKRLLEEMDYQNVEVTSPSSDGGVDVVADIEVGITSIREVVQAKRHRARDTAKGPRCTARFPVPLRCRSGNDRYDLQLLEGHPGRRIRRRRRHPSRSWMVRCWSTCLSNTALASANGRLSCWK